MSDTLTDTLTDVQHDWVRTFCGIDPRLRAPAGEGRSSIAVPDGPGAPPASSLPATGTAPPAGKPPATLPQPMLPDCEIVRGKVPGPVNHVLCATHGHVVDTDARMIIAHSLAEYETAPPGSPAAPAPQPGPSAPASGAEPSGAGWVSKFPTSRSVGDLKGSFAGGVEKFLAALAKAGASVTVSATYRPPERAYLMHYAYHVAKGLDPAKVPARSGVAIDWQHKDGSGKSDPAAAKKAAQAMVDAYDLAYEPSLTSRHTEGLAIDMTISWSGALSIEGADGKPVGIATSPRDGGNAELHRVGAGYGVIKLVSDPPHWSSDGH